jgi:hypothetical protein
VPLFSENGQRTGVATRNGSILIKTLKSGGVELPDISSKEVDGLLAKAEKARILSLGSFVIVPRLTQQSNSPSIPGPVVNTKHNAHGRTASYGKAISSLYRSGLSSVVVMSSMGTSVRSLGVETEAAFQIPQVVRAPSSRLQIQGKITRSCSHLCQHSLLLRLLFEEILLMQCVRK